MSVSFESLLTYVSNEPNVQAIYMGSIMIYYGYLSMEVFHRRQTIFSSVIM